MPFLDTHILGDDLPNKSLCFTYDDGPGDQTIALAQYLYDQDIPATFFVKGNRADGHQDMLETLLRFGHMIGNHTYNHPDLTAIADPAAEVRKEHDLIAQLVREDLFFLRAPYGVWNSDVAQQLNNDPTLTSYKYKGPIFWNIGGTMSTVIPSYNADWYCWQTSTTTQDCGNSYLTEISDKMRGIVLMHDNDDNGPLTDMNTLHMTQYLVPILKGKGYRFFPLHWVPQLADFIRKDGDGNAMPLDWYNLVRGEHVDWHQIVINSASNRYTFERNCITGKIYWNNNEINGLANEIAGRADTQGLIFLFFMGMEVNNNKVWYQVIQPGGAPTDQLEEFAPGTPISGFHRLQIIPQTNTLKFAFWGRESPPKLWSKEQTAPGADTWTPIKLETTPYW